MDRRAPATPARREIVFCHQCENEWYRDEHGLECPECQGDIVEIIESQDDPRAAISPLNEWAPDPEEDDIEQINWQSHEADQVPHERFRVRYERQRSGEGQTEQQEGQQGGPQQQGGWTGLLGNVLRLASDIIQPPNREPHQAQEETHDQAPAPQQQQEFIQRHLSPDGTTYTRHIQGNGFSFTMTTAQSRSGMAPRDSDNPQPYQGQPQQMNDMMQQIFQNIGVFPPGTHPAFPRHDFMMNPEMNNMHAASPFPALFQLLGLPAAAVHGDAVYSQEGLDRIISQLMEQHQTGNAPGPAPESAINSLPSRPITEKDFSDSSTAECSICMDAVDLGEEVTVLPCEHWFHFVCIKAWLSEHDTCPQCRKSIVQRDESEDNAEQGGQHSQAGARGMPGAFPGTRPGQSEGVFDRMRDVFGNGSNPHH